MFCLKIHTVDNPQPFYTTPNSSSLHYNPINELRGVAHLFRNLQSLSSSSSSSVGPTYTLSNPSVRSTLLFVAAVPNYLSFDDFLSFCDHHVNYFSQLIFLRNDGMEDRYSVVIRLVDQLSSDGFYCCYNGKRFRQSEGEICHIYFMQAVEYTEFAEIASEPPPGFAELPTCPICLERLDQDTSAIQTTLCDHSFRCSCVSKWTYMSCQVCRLCQHEEEKPTCAVCGTLEIPCVCLICGFVGCGRYEKGHAIMHWNDTQHGYSLELEKQQIWDYVGDKYVHRLNQSKIGSKPVMRSYNNTSEDGGCATCVSNEEYSEIGGALFSSKVDAIVDEYNHLLATQMETQRQHYETLLNEAKVKREVSISKRKEMADYEMRKLQDEIEEAVKETKVIASCLWC
nr:PREDICTED: BRCA1-associated protein isoform X2 [Daucus carota subsp. sativus]